MISDLEAFDFRSEVVYPHLTIPADTPPEQIAFAKRIRQLARENLLLIAPSGFGFPPLVAGLAPEQIEAVMRLGALSQKIHLLTTFDIPEHLEQIETINRALCREAGENPEEADRRLARIRLYINDHRRIFTPTQP